MSTSRFRISLAILACLVVGFLAVNVTQTLLADYDGWSIVRGVEVEVDSLIIEPDDLLTRRDRDTIQKVVEEARDYGIPWSVAVYSDASLEPGVAPEDKARDLLDDLDIESRPGADDGLLMLVAVPEDDHTATSVHFVTGDNFYPTGGITPERLQWIADVQMAPIIADNNIGDAVIEGATWVEWMQLFMPKPDPASTNLQQGLQTILHPLGTIALAGLALLVGAAAVAVAWLTRRNSDRESPLALNPIRAAALANGRVDHRVVAGMILGAIDRGLLIQTAGGLAVAHSENQIDRAQTDHLMEQSVTSLRADGIRVTPARLVRFFRGGSLPQRLEDELATAGYLDPRSYRFRLALRIAAVAGSLAGLLTLVLAVFGEVESTLAAAIALSVISLTVLIWNEHRSWTTNAGHAAVKTWLSHHQQPDDRERFIFETIRQLDDVTDGGSFRSDRSPLLASLRYQG